jgi:hypothetical protein
MPGQTRKLELLRIGRAQDMSPIYRTPHILKITPNPMRKGFLQREEWVFYAQGSRRFRRSHGGGVGAQCADQQFSQPPRTNQREIHSQDWAALPGPYATL